MPQNESKDFVDQITKYWEDRAAAIGPHATLKEMARALADVERRETERLAVAASAEVKVQPAKKDKPA